MSETDLQRRIQLELSDLDTRLWRNNVGNFWQGTVISQTANTVTLGHPRRVQCGLVPGASDLIGLRSVVITPAMLGKRLAIFSAIEVKSIHGRASEDQINFVETILSLGGRAGVAKTVKQSRMIIEGGC